MRFSRKSLGLLLAAATGAVVTTAATTASVSPSIPNGFGLEKKSGLFGIQKRSNGDIIGVVNSISRGGSTAAMENDEEEEVEEEAPVLYLPGLLESIVGDKKVG